MKLTSIKLLTLCVLPSLFLCVTVGLAADAGESQSRHMASDFELSANPSAAGWKVLPAFFFDTDRKGVPVEGHRTEVRCGWTTNYLYFFYTCPYRDLRLHPNPSQTKETMRLWEWDVVELFISSEENYLRHYQELQVSPQGEWVDLDINRDAPLQDPAKWDSKFEVRAQINHAAKIWYGAMRIPWSALGVQTPTSGRKLHFSVCRIQGQSHVQITTKPGSFHQPQGVLELTQ